VLISSAITVAGPWWIRTTFPLSARSYKSLLKIDSL